jgi:hypothetical protein
MRALPIARNCADVQTTALLFRRPGRAHATPEMLIDKRASAKLDPINTTVVNKC